MKAGEDIELLAPMSERLYYNLDRQVIPLLARILPGLNVVRIRPLTFERPDISPKAVVTGFSGGVDSFCVLADHPVTHLVFNNVGSQGLGGRALFEQHFQRLAPVVAETGLPFLKLDSNLDELIDLPFQKTHTVRNVAAILTLQNLAGRYLYASTYSPRHCHNGPTYDMATADPVLLPLLSTETLECVSAGGRHSSADLTLAMSRTLQRQHTGHTVHGYSRHVTHSDEEWSMRSSRVWLSGEPSLLDVLSDDVVQAVMMRCDGVQREDIDALLQRARRMLRREAGHTEEALRQAG